MVAQYPWKKCAGNVTFMRYTYRSTIDLDSKLISLISFSRNILLRIHFDHKSIKYKGTSILSRRPWRTKSPPCDSHHIGWARQSTVPLFPVQTQPAFLHGPSRYILPSLSSSSHCQTAWRISSSSGKQSDLSWTPLVTIQYGRLHGVS